MRRRVMKHLCSPDTLSPTVPCFHDVLPRVPATGPTPAALQTLETAVAILDNNSLSPTLHCNRVVPDRTRAIPPAHTNTHHPCHRERHLFCTPTSCARLHATSTFSLGPIHHPRFRTITPILGLRSPPAPPLSPSRPTPPSLLLHATALFLVHAPIPAQPAALPIHPRKFSRTQTPRHCPLLHWVRVSLRSLLAAPAPIWSEGRSPLCAHQGFRSRRRLACHHQAIQHHTLRVRPNPQCGPPDLALQTTGVGSLAESRGRQVVPAASPPSPNSSGPSPLHDPQKVACRGAVAISSVQNPRPISRGPYSPCLSAQHGDGHPRSAAPCFHRCRQQAPGLHHIMPPSPPTRSLYPCSPRCLLATRLPSLHHGLGHRFMVGLPASSGRICTSPPHLAVGSLLYYVQYIMC